MSTPKTRSSAQLGQPVPRVDGRAKVTGQAQYAGEFAVPDLLHGFVVSAPIAKGKILAIDPDEALAMPGVVQVFTHENRPSLAWFDRSWKDQDAPAGSPFRPLHDEVILYSGQPVALVVAETFEIARAAATLVHVEYQSQTPETDLRAARDRARHPDGGKGGYQPPPGQRGDADQALASAAVQVDAEYSTPIEHHNPMEPHATTVAYHKEDDSLTIYDKTQGVTNTHGYVVNVFGLSKNKVRVRSPFVGGAFGSGLRPQYQLFLAVLAATQLKRSVRVVLTRQQMFTFGHRPQTLQRVALGCDTDGKLQAVVHEAISETSRFEDYVETLVSWSGLAYQCENVRLDYKLAEVDLFTPLDMRAPGAVQGVYALESALDELAAKAGIDPLEFRLRNYAERDQNKDKPFSSRELRACYRQAAERFGWSRRNPQPRSMRDGHALIGWGMATGIWEALQNQASARAVLNEDGKLTVSSGTSDIGPGTYTVMTQIAAETLGLPLEDVVFQLGDSTLPPAPLQGGSWTVSSVGTAVKLACEAIGRKLLKQAAKRKDSPLAQVPFEEVEFVDGQIRVRAEPSRFVSLAELVRDSGGFDETVDAKPDRKKQAPYSLTTNSAVFVEVQVDEDLGTIRVTRVVSAIAAGRILNPKLAGSQILGGIVWGIGMALQEEALVDHKLGRMMNHSLAEYHIPVHADIHDIDVIFVDEQDEAINPLGVKGVGEIGIIGVAAAVANAVYHATGKRVRDLPITLDKLL